MVRIFPIYGPSGSLLAQVLVHQWSTDSSNPLKLGVKVAERTGLETVHFERLRNVFSYF